MKIGQHTLDLTKPKVMAIINITPDSFYWKSRAITDENILNMADKAISDGASILDIGGASSRPGADYVSEQEELERVDRGVRIIRKKYQDIILSIDTFRSNIIKHCMEEYGPVIVNDISAGDGDPKMIETVAKYRLPYIAMHMRGTPQNMHQFTEYSDITKILIEFFKLKLEFYDMMDIKEVILDPGFGFSKTIKQNFELLGELRKLTVLNRPILAGISRKTMIYKTLNTTPENALNGTSALHWECLRQGASILRAHDVKEAMEVITLYNKFKSTNV